MQAYTLSCEQGEKVTRETRVRAGLFMAQHEIMYGDAAAAIGKVQVNQQLSVEEKIAKTRPRPEQAYYEKFAYFTGVVCPLSWKGL